MGPAVSSLDSVVRLINGGMNVARINLSHGTQEEHIQWIEWIKEARDIEKKSCAIMLDTTGNEIRVKDLPKDFIEVSEKDIFTITINPTGDKQFSLHPFHLVSNIQVGTKIIFGDGNLYGIVTDIVEGRFEIEMQTDGILKSRIGCNIVNTKINFPVIAERDVKDIEFACEQDIDIIAASFVSCSETVMRMRKIILDYDPSKSNIIIVAKIENMEGLNNIDSIIQVSNGIMIARGDLGIELGENIGRMSHIQKTIIRKSMVAGKDVIVATELLDSMVRKCNPTRAEVSDVCNAVFDGASALMLSGETAIGKYPFDALNMMRSIIQRAEADFDYENFLNLHEGLHLNPSASVALAAVKVAQNYDYKAIFIFTSSGNMARLVSKHRLQVNCFALTDIEKTYHQMSFVWGVHPVFSSANSHDISLELLKDYVLQLGEINVGDRVIITTGNKFGKSGSTNRLIIESIGKTLLFSEKGYGERVHGKVSLFPFDNKDSTNSIIVLPSCSRGDYVTMQRAKGVIIANHPHDIESIEYAMTFAKEHEISVLINFSEVYEMLHDGEFITIDPKNGSIHKDKE